MKLKPSELGPSLDKAANLIVRSNADELNRCIRNRQVHDSGRCPPLGRQVSPRPGIIGHFLIRTDCSIESHLIWSRITEDKAEREIIRQSKIDKARKRRAEYL